MKFIAVARMTNLHMLLATIVIKDLKFLQLDVKTA